MKFLRREEGFTLIELMVVILIIGILVAIAVPVFQSARDTADLRACQANLRTIDGAIQTYNAQFGTWPADVPALVTADFLRSNPDCPVEGAGAYDNFDNSGSSPIAECSGGHTYQ